MNVEEVLTDKHIIFTHSGGDYVVKCLNPEHDDANPSMRIDKITGKYNCFSCGFAGNLYKHFNIDQNIADLRVLNMKEKISNIIASTSLTIPLGASFFSKDYRNISAETYKEFKAFIYDEGNLEGRLVFPITDIHNNIVVFVARLLYSEVGNKYLNDPPNASMPLFPAKVTPRNGSIILVEGLFDLLNLYDKGIKNVVCTFGVGLGAGKGYKKEKETLSRLHPYKLQGVTKIYILYDGDKAGIEGAIKLQDKLLKEYIVEIIDLPEGSDPGTLTDKEIMRLKRYLYD